MTLILKQLQKKASFDINYRMQSRTKKWRILRGFAKFWIRLGVTQSALLRRVAHASGITALHYAARRGDVEIVNILLDAGADPYIENDLGMNVFEICENAGPFPSVMQALKNYDKKKV